MAILKIEGGVIGYRYDQDTINFINILNQDPNGVKLTQTQRIAIHNLVNGLKKIDVWNNSQVILPFIGDSAFKHSKNLRNLSLNSIISGTFMHNSYGITNTGLSNSNSIDTQLVLGTDIINGNYNIIMAITVAPIETNNYPTEYSSNSSPTGQLYFGARWKSPNTNAYFNNATGTQLSYSNNTDARGIYMENHNGTNSKYKDNILKHTNFTSTAFSSSNLRLLGNSTGIGEQPSDKTLGLIIIGKSLTSDKLNKVYYVVENYLSILSRNPFRY